MKKGARGFKSFTIRGKSMPYHADSPEFDIASLWISATSMGVSLLGADAGEVRCIHQLWDQSVYELESLAVSLRAAASGPFPRPCEAPDAAVGAHNVRFLTLALSIEVGYSLQNPRAQRATFFCQSRTWGLAKELAVYLGVALNGHYRSAVLTPSQAKTFAEWIEGKVQGTVKTK